jgi:GntR family hexuronate regulon transcriptional repressor
MSALAANTPRLYEQVAATVEREITEGRYQPGERLASERDLAEDFGVSRPTVRRAVIALEMRGPRRAPVPSWSRTRLPLAR